MKKRKVCALIGFMFAATFALSACGALDKAGNVETYDFDTDKVPSVTSIVGDRSTTNVESGTNNGAEYKQYTYKSDSVKEDLIDYVNALMEKGWTVTEGFNLDDPSGEGKLGLNSNDEGMALILSLAFEDGKYAIKVTKIEGSITINE